MNNFRTTDLKKVKAWFIELYKKILGFKGDPIIKVSVIIQIIIVVIS